MMTEQEISQAEQAFMRWFLSQDIHPADAVHIMTRVMSLILAQSAKTMETAQTQAEKLCMLLALETNIAYVALNNKKGEQK